MRKKFACLVEICVGNHATSIEKQDLWKSTTKLFGMPLKWERFLCLLLLDNSWDFSKTVCLEIRVGNHATSIVFHEKEDFWKSATETFWPRINSAKNSWELSVGHIVFLPAIALIKSLSERKQIIKGERALSPCSPYYILRMYHDCHHNNIRYSPLRLAPG